MSEEMIGKLVAGKWDLIELIGEGGMGAVYEARHVTTGKLVAVKLIHSEFIRKDDVLLARFEREAEAAARVATRYIAELIETGHDDATGQPYLAIELLQGESLLDTITRLGPLPPELVVRIGAHVCMGLDKAHSAGIIHRDIKPANLFLARVDGGAGDEVVCKLLDFGVAKLKMEQAASTENVSLTQTGSMLGSPMYMSPEQARGLKTIDGRADLWSLGVVLYQLLSGRTPYQDVEGLGELIITICSEEPKPLGTLAPWVPEPIAAAVHAALRLASKDRYQSAAEMLEALGRCLGGDGHDETLFAIRQGMVVAANPAGVAAGSGPAAAATASNEELEATVALDRSAGAEPAPKPAPVKRTLPLPAMKPAAAAVGATTPLEALQGGGTLALDADALAALEAAPLARPAAAPAPEPRALGGVGGSAAADDGGGENLSATMALDVGELPEPPARKAADSPLATMMLDDSPLVGLGSGTDARAKDAPDKPSPFVKRAGADFGEATVERRLPGAYRRSEGPATERSGRRGSAKVAIGIGVALGLGGGAVAMILLLRNPAGDPTPAPRTSASVVATETPSRGEPATPSASAATSASASAAPGASASGAASASAPSVKVAIAQAIAGMSATVDGKKAEIKNGALELVGAPGDKHLVTLSLQGRSKSWEVTIREGGTEPATIGPLPPARP
ncbi:MAG: serine/threonine protein kinase [Myxococcales bacterium]|nr:serine/threonine protein kinase [Myxococcales bacterium]